MQGAFANNVQGTMQSNGATLLYVSADIIHAMQIALLNSNVMYLPVQGKVKPLRML
jgi:hypothetical protein